MHREFDAMEEAAALQIQAGPGDPAQLGPPAEVQHLPVRSAADSACLSGRGVQSARGRAQAIHLYHHGPRAIQQEGRVVK